MRTFLQALDNELRCANNTALFEFGQLLLTKTMGATMTLQG